VKEYGSNYGLGGGSRHHKLTPMSYQRSQREKPPPRITMNRNSQTMSQYHEHYTPEDSAVVFIDHQPQMGFGMEYANTMVHHAPQL
jgi:hypothetical protein